MNKQPLPDAFAQLLAIHVTGSGDQTDARATVSTHDLNPHGTAQGACLYCLAGLPHAAAANDSARSGIVNAVHVDDLRRSKAGDRLRAKASDAERLPREDRFEIRVSRDPDEEAVARSTGRATRRPRTSAASVR